MTFPTRRDFEELDFQNTAMGELSLRRRRLRTLDGLEIFEVKLGNAFLMSSLFHEVEVALANLSLEGLGGPLDVVVGGLGLGYTAVAALRHESVRSLLVVDALQTVIDWHERGLVPLGPVLTEDARCRFVHSDFFEMAASPKTGFDPHEPGRKFHAVLLDIDHSPRNLLHEHHAAFYEPEGLRRLASQIQPGGVFSMWSDDPPDETFLAALSTAFSDSRAHVVPFENPLLETESRSTVYIARQMSAELRSRNGH